MDSTLGGFATLVRAAGEGAGVAELGVRASVVRASLVFCGEDCRGVCEVPCEDGGAEFSGIRHVGSGH